jgi:hypothetical protein
MQSQISYYTPKLEDLHPGYECEIRDIDFTQFSYSGITPEVYENLFRNYTIGGPYSSNPEDYNFLRFAQLIGKNDLRTPFLTKEQIEAEGWEFTGRGVSLWFKHKEDIILMWHGHHLNKLEIMFSPHDQVLHINATFIGGEEMRFFEGICPSINEFRKIIKLCSINKDLENLY